MTRCVFSVRFDVQKAVRPGAILDDLGGTRADTTITLVKQSWTGYASREDSEIVKGEE